MIFPKCICIFVTSQDHWHRSVDCKSHLRKWNWRSGSKVIAVRKICQNQIQILYLGHIWLIFGTWTQIFSTWVQIVGHKNIIYGPVMPISVVFGPKQPISNTVSDHCCAVDCLPQPILAQFYLTEIVSHPEKVSHSYGLRLVGIA